VRSFAETVSFSGRIGKARRHSNIASETNKIEAFGVVITLRQYTKQH
jgi:hypothetical protein